MRSAARAKRPAAAPRADFGKPIGGYIASKPAHLRDILVALRKLIEEAAPEAQSSIKWGMPFFTVGGAMMCAMGAAKAHVNLILVGPPGAFCDPQGHLEGKGKGGRHLKLRSLDELPKASVRGWLRTSAKYARDKGK